MAGKTVQHALAGEHEQQLWREKRDGKCTLERRYPLGAFAIARVLAGDGRRMCAIAAAFEEARLKEIGRLRRFRESRRSSRTRPASGGGFTCETSADECMMMNRRSLSPWVGRPIDAFKYVLIVETTAIGDDDGHDCRSHYST
jgi:hypothetical protein